MNNPFSSKDSQRIISILSELQKSIKELKVTDAEVKAILDKVDLTTNQIGSNLEKVASAQSTEADVVQKISDEVDALVAKAGSLGISTETASQLQAIADRLQASSDNSD